MAGWGRPGVLCTLSVPELVLCPHAESQCWSAALVSGLGQAGRMLVKIGIHITLQARACQQEQGEEEAAVGSAVVRGFY